MMKLKFLTSLLLICFTVFGLKTQAHGDHHRDPQQHSPHSCADHLSSELKNPLAQKVYTYLKSTVESHQKSWNKKQLKSITAMLPQLYKKMAHLPSSLSSSPGLSQVFEPWFDAILSLQARESELLGSEFESRYFDLITFHIKFLYTYLSKDSLSAAQKAVILDQINTLNSFKDSDFNIYIYEFRNSVTKFYDYNEAIFCH